MGRKKKNPTLEKVCNFLDEIKVSIEPLCNTIQGRIDEDIMNRRRRTEGQFANQIVYYIARECNKKDLRFSNAEAYDMYSSKENTKMVYDKILDLLTIINTKYGIDFSLNKKTLCMLMGINLSAYQELLTTSLESNSIFVDMEEFLISIKTTSSETGTRNFKAVETTLSMDSRYGGHSISFDSKTISTNAKQNQLGNIDKAKEILEAKYNDL